MQNVKSIIDRMKFYSRQSRINSFRFVAWDIFRAKVISEEEIVPPAVEHYRKSCCRIKVGTKRGKDNVIRLTLPLTKGEKLLGFGERFNAVNQAGNTFDVWTQEGAVGLPEGLSKILTALNFKWNPFPHKQISYKPIPWYISSENYGLLINSTSRVMYDLGTKDSRTIEIQVVDTSAEIILLHDLSPAQMIRELTDILGRPKQLPDWAFAPWNDAHGGEAHVESVAHLLRKERIPCSAIWYEDWQGGNYNIAWFTSLAESHWIAKILPARVRKYFNFIIFPVLREPDKQMYPDVKGLNEKLNGLGIKGLGYYYPYLYAHEDAAEFALASDYVLKDADGRPFAFKILGCPLYQVDLSNPDAFDWYKESLRKGIREYGFNGWMADFGEYTPPNAMPFSGENGYRHHNRYPVLWAKLNRELFEEEFPDNDYVFFSRSYGLGMQEYACVSWTGDSNTNMEKWDGLPSNLPGLLSAGLSGMPIYTVDIGGYMSFLSGGRDAETLMRWTELAAFLPVMRTHKGTHPRWSVQFDHSQRTLAHFKRFACFHTALFPTFKSLVDEATRTGLPVCRHLIVHYPEDEAAWDIEDQFLLGENLLVAPVLNRGQKQRSVYLPAGSKWKDIKTGTEYPGGTRVEFETTVGELPLLIKSGGYVVLLDRYADTLLSRKEVSDSGIGTIEDADVSYSILVSSDFEGKVRIWDGTEIDIRGKDSDDNIRHEYENELLPEDIYRNWRCLAKIDAGTKGTDIGTRSVILNDEASRSYTICVI